MEDNNKEHEETKIKIVQLKSLISLDMIISLKSGKDLKVKSLYMKRWSVILSALITISLGLSIGAWWGTFGKNLALILSAVLTAFSTWDSFVKYEIRSNQEHINSNKLTILFKDILLYEVGNHLLKLELYKEYEKRYSQLQEEYLEERKPNPDPPANKES